MIFGQDITFWISALGATFVRVATSERHSFIRSIVMVIAGIFAAWAFTQPTLAYLVLDPQTYTIPIAALWALTGEGVMRWFTKTAEDPKSLIDILKLWRGK